MSMEIHNFYNFSTEFHSSVYIKDAKIWNLPDLSRIITLGDNSVQGGPSVTNACEDIIGYTKERFDISEILYIDSTGAWAWYDAKNQWISLPFNHGQPATEDFVKRAFIHKKLTLAKEGA